MAQTNITERRKKLEQRKHRLLQLESTLKIQERKQRTRRLIALGGLVSKAQLETWNANALLGGLLSLKEKEMDEAQIATWIHQGGKAFSLEKTEAAKDELKNKRI